MTATLPTARREDFANELSRLCDVIIEGCNANDPDLLLQLTEWFVDAATLDSIFHYSEHHPSAILTPGQLHGRPVAVVWNTELSGEYGIAGYLEVGVARGRVLCEYHADQTIELAADQPVG